MEKTVTRIVIPNYHVILIHFPLGLLGIGLLIELLSFLWKKSSFHLAGRWMILLGTLALAPLVTSGIFALYDVATHGADDGDTWAQVKIDSHFADTDWHLVRNHILRGAIGSGIALVAVCGWIAACDPNRRRFYWPVLIALLAAMGLITSAAWHGGEMVFRQGFGVAGKLDIAEANPTADDPNAVMSFKDKFDTAISPMQIHLILAGLVVAGAMATMALSIRRTQESVSVPPPPVADGIQTQFAQNPTDLLAPLPKVDPPALSTPGRFWLLVAALTLATIILGFYVGDFLIWPKIIDTRHLQHAFTNLQTPGRRRMGLHIIFGTLILVISLLLAIQARWKPAQRMMVGIFSSTLALVIAAQIWMGILLLYDSDRGSVAHFNPPPAPPISGSSASANQ
jgi:uncharacterized membrane protein